MRFSEITLQLLAFRGLALLIIAGVHGAALAGVAVLLGDRGPKYDGRLTLSPGGHLDPVGSVATLLFGLGWTKPVAVEAQRLRFGRVGIVLVVLAGFVALMALAAVFNVLVRPALTTLPHTAALATAAFLRAASSLSVWFALLSLIPLPPLAGGMVLQAFGIRIPPTAQWLLVALLFVAVATGVARDWLGPGFRWLAGIVIGG